MSKFRSSISRVAGGLLVALLTLGFAGPAAAAKRASIVVDLQTGKVLDSNNADSLRYPASITKVMTLYLLFQDLESGRVRFSDMARASKRAQSQPPSELGLKAGDEISLKDATLALVTKSANDVAVVIAEHLEGSVEAFAERMTATAHALGMTRTTFTNPSGLPDKDMKTTARDLALLGTAIQQHFPEKYELFSTRSFRYGKRKYKNHNRILGKVAGVDGIKTGYTRASGFNLLASVHRDDGRHIVAVALGHSSGRNRERFMRSLIADNLPKASKQPVNPILVAKVPRRGSRIIAAAPKPRPVRAQIGTPAPMKPETVSVETPVAAASALPPSASALAQPEPDRKPLPSAVRSKAKAAARAANLIPPPLARPETPPKKVAAAGDVAQAFVPGSDESTSSDETSDSAEKVGEWFVQVGVTPTERGARSLLDIAKEKAKALLDGVAPMTEKIKSDDRVRYRARFAGLDRAAAKEICKTLKKKDVACFTTRN